MRQITYIAIIMLVISQTAACGSGQSLQDQATDTSAGVEDQTVTNDVAVEPDSSVAINNELVNGQHNSADQANSTNQRVDFTPLTTDIHNLPTCSANRDFSTSLLPDDSAWHEDDTGVCVKVCASVATIEHYIHKRAV